MAITLFHKPETLDECLQLKARTGAEGVLLAGGTDVLVHMHEGKLNGSEIIDLTSVEELKAIAVNGSTISIGACATFTEVSASQTLISYSGLTEACRSVGSPQIRNAGTLGGNIANGSPAADCAPPLLALAAHVILKKEGSERKIPLNEFYMGKGSTVMNNDEVLTSLEFPVLPQHAVIVFEKLGLRNALAISRICLSLYLETDNGTISKARVASGSLGLTPIRETEIEAFLTGQPLDGNWIAEGMELFSEQVSRRLAGRGTMPYKRIAVKGVFENAARKALKLLK